MPTTIDTLQIIVDAISAALAAAGVTGVGVHAPRIPHDKITDAMPCIQLNRVTGNSVESEPVIDQVMCDVRVYAATYAARQTIVNALARLHAMNGIATAGGYVYAAERVIPWFDNVEQLSEAKSIDLHQSSWTFDLGE